MAVAGLSCDEMKQNHHINLYNGTWFVFYTIKEESGDKRRVHKTLKTKSAIEARKRRDVMMSKEQNLWTPSLARRAAPRTATHTNHPLYYTYHSMLARCYNQKHVHFNHYGGRGIVVCDHWRESFWNFVKDVGERPAGFLLDREDNDGDYEPGNCRWVDRKTQMRNCRNNVFLTIDGETKLMADWAEESGRPLTVIYSRIYTLGWDTKRAVFEPVGQRGHRSHFSK